ncbi:MAG: hypothetical protein HYZ53_29510 [Planctomycetes bacterium]|nr:hypothetical protein [Planctomycetota bacterium]
MPAVAIGVNAFLVGIAFEKLDSKVLPKTLLLVLAAFTTLVLTLAVVKHRFFQESRYKSRRNIEKNAFRAPSEFLAYAEGGNWFQRMSTFKWLIGSMVATAIVDAVLAIDALLGK